MIGKPTEPRPASDLRRIAKGVATRYTWVPDAIGKDFGMWEYRGLPVTWKDEVPPLLYESDEENQDHEWRMGDTHFVYSSYERAHIADTPVWHCVRKDYIPPRSWEDDLRELGIAEVMRRAGIPGML